nr:ABC transporter substrate-binding protein [Faunimonas pinastri]
MLGGVSLPTLAATPKDTLVEAFAFDDIITLDPGESYELSTGEILGNSYQTLVRFDIDDPAKIYGDAAQSWTISEDGKTYTFKMKPGLKFASGDPLTAEDAVYSLQRAVLLDKPTAFILGQFGLTKDNVKDKVKKVDDLTLTFEVDKPYAPTFVLNCLTATVSMIVDEKLLQQHEANGDMGNGWLKTHYAGSGPMKIREWRANEIVVLERNDNYNGEKSKLARVIYRHVKEAATQRLLLEKGDVDVARNLGPVELDAMAKNPDIKTVSAPKGTLYYFSLNQKNPILAKPEVREAMKYLVDYDAIGATLLKGIGEIHQTSQPDGFLGAIDDKPYHLDVAKAKELLAKAGYKDGFSVTMDVRNTEPVTGIAQAVQQSFAKAGIKMEIIPGDGKQTLTKYRARNHDLYIGPWGADYQDPHSNASGLIWNPDNSDNSTEKSPAWRNAWQDKAMNDEVQAAVLERDTQKRIALYQDMQRKLLADGPFVIIYQQIEVASLRKDVGNFRLGPSFDTNYAYKATKG